MTKILKVVSKNKACEILNVKHTTFYNLYRGKIRFFKEGKNVWYYLEDVEKVKEQFQTVPQEIKTKERIATQKFQIVD
ncbi:helix-turn-helix domain-containing protein [Flavobacterium sp. HSC-61S13]|uniref:helix-turn-helix domain-containing protein n=1 Tax=Flavobacterium sp. HSC-61S13 TaxID=2910963 RepID=UPI00209D3568|nr:helix-turn-helix domain-containing protein [Flavobacterium sp. HSC-61S13]MCP1996614.1 hypothetical protein [Flavobacterium sp. HSC-61S13]